MSAPKPSPTSLAELAPDASPAPFNNVNSLSIQLLTNGDEREVLAFLAERPLHTVVMAGHILDNGLESPLNRGRFYACRDDAGCLEGVSLIGHATLVEIRSEAALAAFARLAQACAEAHLIMGEEEKVERFWRYYAQVGQLPRRVCRELLFEQRWPVEAFAPLNELRLATLADLEEVMLVQAEMAFMESGVNPLEADLAGFSQRCARRIEQGRVWVWTKDGRLVFKTDIISETPEVTYLEGIYVNPLDRGRGLGALCVSQLGRTLLQRTRSISILVNEQNQRACAFFERIGYKLRSCYDTVFLERPKSAPAN